MPAWADFMQPTVTQRVPLEEVARWWADVWQWRQAEVDAGRGLIEDAHPSGRVPRSVVRAKFSFLSATDELDLVPLIQAEARRRKLKPVLREMRRWQMRGTTRYPQDN